MNVIPIITGLLGGGTDLAKIFLEKHTFQVDDILVVSSKIVAVSEKRVIDLASISPSKQALKLSNKTGLAPSFVELILHETKRMNGSVEGVCPHAILTRLKPHGMKSGSILCPNAGVDQSNAEVGHAIPWPEDPVRSAQNLQKKLGVPVIISDSCCHMGRLGVTAFALTVSGLKPVQSEIGNNDLHGRSLRITHEATADQLATAGNAVMGNSAQAIPAAVIRGFPIPRNTEAGWVEGIDPKDDLFREILRSSSGTLRS